ncbi:protein NRT1/ PTR FAMILY 2.11-like [Triticum dicoccoides]|uniref:protein NRT1/ PTR FAMILY 2.11-like n=1 Tax=Triticum dicoccoides TaxID=85692 RepID=UPI00188E7C7F|nr:protein NRT1/ PTR FAMILY 2.11-like [Triticum dicoccoides]
MDDANKPQRPQQQEEQKPMSEDKTTMMKVLSEDGGGEAEPSWESGDGDAADHNHRGWKAMPYVIGNETFEKLGTIGTLSNLLVYLTTIYHMPSVKAATLLNVFSGTSNLATVFGAYISDTYLGRYIIITVGTVSSFIGMLILTLTAALHSLHPPTCSSSKVKQCQGLTDSQIAALLVSFFFLVVGAGGIRPCNLAFGADQFDPRTADGRRGIASFFNRYYFTFTIAIMISATVIIYLQSYVNWALGLAVPAALMGLSCAVFIMGTRLYVRVRPEGSPFTSFAQVLVAATRKRHLRQALGAEAELFDPPHKSKLVSKLAYTNQFTCLDKAAMWTPKDLLSADGKTPVHPWRLCTVQQVEEVKCLARIIPVWSAGIVYSVVLTQLGTYVVLQAAQTDRRISKSSGFQIPQGSFIIFQMLALTLWIPMYDRFVVPALRRFTGCEGGITLLQRIGVGLVLSVVTMLVSAAVERRRRRIGSLMPWFWLVPQQLLAGLSEAFGAIGQIEFYYRQFPENMRSVAGAVSFLGIAVASYASGLMVTVVHRATRRRDGRPDWLAQDLDEGRVDLFYLVKAALAGVNVVYFVACARWYKFKRSGEDALASDDVDLDESPEKAANNMTPV